MKELSVFRYSKTSKNHQVSWENHKKLMFFWVVIWFFEKKKRIADIYQTTYLCLRTTIINLKHCPDTGPGFGAVSKYQLTPVYPGYLWTMYIVLEFAWPLLWIELTKVELANPAHLPRMNSKKHKVRNYLRLFLGLRTQGWYLRLGPKAQEEPN